VWGASYRSIQDRNSPTFTVAVTPTSAQYTNSAPSCKTKVTLLDQRLRRHGRSKLSTTNFTGFESKPNIRFLGNISKVQSVWVGMIPAVRIPALTEEGLRLNTAVVPPEHPRSSVLCRSLKQFTAAKQFRAEDLIAYEIGYRVQATSSFSADIAAFNNNYTNLRTAEPGTPFCGRQSRAHRLWSFPSWPSNKMSGERTASSPISIGKRSPQLKLFGSYSFLAMKIPRNSDSTDPTLICPMGENPEHQFYFPVCLGPAWTHRAEPDRGATSVAYRASIFRVTHHSTAAFTEGQAERGIVV